jgi:hypothetical protein
MTPSPLKEQLIPHPNGRPPGPSNSKEGFATVMGAPSPLDTKKTAAIAPTKTYFKDFIFGSDLNCTCDYNMDAQFSEDLFLSRRKWYSSLQRSTEAREFLCFVGN